MGKAPVPESWIGREVTVEVKGRKGGSYLVLGQLQDVTDEEITILFRPPEDPRSYPWEIVSDVRLREEP